VVVDAPHRPVVSDSAYELLCGTNTRISAEIVALNDLVKMCVIFFANIVVLIRPIMPDWGYRSLSIKGAVSMGHDEAEMAIRPAYSSPLA